MDAMKQSNVTNVPKCMLLKNVEFYFRNLFNNSMLASVPTCYSEINFNFNISKNLCQFVKMCPEFYSLLIWTDFTQGTDTKEMQTLGKYPRMSSPNSKGGRGAAGSFWGKLCILVVYPGSGSSRPLESSQSEAGDSAIKTLQQKGVVPGKKRSVKVTGSPGHSESQSQVPGQPPCSLGGALSSGERGTNCEAFLPRSPVAEPSKRREGSA